MINQKGLILPAKEVIKGAISELSDYQKGTKRPIITRYAHFNNNLYGGMIGNMAIGIAGRSGTGKSYCLQTIEEDYLNDELNPGAANRILLRCSWEMVIRSLLVRAIRREIPISIKDIYYKEKTPEQQAIINDILARESKENIYYMTIAPTPDEFEENLTAFLRAHKEAEYILVTIDHFGLVDASGSDTTTAMNELSMIINKLNICGEFPNVIWIFLMQLNRSIDDRTDIRHLAPRRSDMYGSDKIYQNTSLFLVLQRPEKQHFTEYMQFPPEKYPHLTEFMKNPNMKQTNFLTQNNMFWHYLKLREEDDTMDDVYIEKIHPDDIRTIDMESKIKEQKASPANFYNIPTAEKNEDREYLPF